MIGAQVPNHSVLSLAASPLYHRVQELSLGPSCATNVADENQSARGVPEEMPWCMELRCKEHGVFFPDLVCLMDIPGSVESFA